MCRLTERKRQDRTLSKPEQFLNTIAFAPKSQAELIQYEKELKLSKLEDLEEELEIDLATLIQALTRGIYIDFYGDISYEKAEYLKLNLADGVIHWDCYDYHFPGAGITYYLCDYGKTWALTKEGLEDE